MRNLKNQQPIGYVTDDLYPIWFDICECFRYRLELIRHISLDLAGKAFEEYAQNSTTKSNHEKTSRAIGV